MFKTSKTFSDCKISRFALSDDSAASASLSLMFDSSCDDDTELNCRTVTYPSNKVGAYPFELDVYAPLAPTQKFKYILNVVGFSITSYI